MVHPITKLDNTQEVGETSKGSQAREGARPKVKAQAKTKAPIKDQSKYVKMPVYKEKLTGFVQNEDEMMMSKILLADKQIIQAFPLQYEMRRKLRTKRYVKQSKAFLMSKQQFAYGKDNEIPFEEKKH